MKKTIHAIAFIFIISAGMTDIFSLQDKVSCITNMKVFRQNGFKPEELQYKKAGVLLDNGLFRITLKTGLETEICIEIFKNESGGKKNILKGYVLGREKIIIDSSCIQESDGGIFIISFCLPEKTGYDFRILAKSEGSYLTEILKYNIETKKLTDRKVFIREAFHKALTEGKTVLMTEIIQSDDNKATVRSRDDNGENLLLRACREGSIDAVKLLTGKIITSNKITISENNGIEKNPSDILFDIDDSDNEGRTGLMLAAMNGHENVAELLLSKNANYYIRSNEGMTALDYSKKNNFKKIQQLLEKYPVMPDRMPAEQLSGKWEGLIDSYYSPFFGADSKIINIEISEKNGRLKGKALYIKNLDIHDAINAVKGKMPDNRELSYTDKFVCEQELNIFTNMDEILFIGVESRILYNGQKYPEAIPYLKLKSSYFKNGIIYGKDSDGRLFYLENTNTAKNVKYFSPERSKVTEAVSGLFPDLKYKYYLPKSYDPSKPASVIIFYLPGADAVPLSVQTAEENGWISVGLYKDCQEIFKAVIEIKNKFNTAGEKIYLAGFSMTGGNAHYAAYTLGYHCGGIICMGNWGSSAPHYGIPCFYIFGDKDFLKDQFAFHDKGKIYMDFRIYFNEVLKPEYGNIVELRTFPGGHAYGVPELHAEAMKWLKGR